MLPCGGDTLCLRTYTVDGAMGGMRRFLLTLTSIETQGAWVPLDPVSAKQKWVPLDQKQHGKLMGSLGPSICNA